MRIMAVIANLAQVGIVLAIFIESGLMMGAWAVLGLFSLLIVALLNQIVIFNYAVNKPVHQPLVGSRRAPVKRGDLRVSYTMAPQPTVIIDERPFSVLDLAENGMRFAIDRRENLKTQFIGRISLLSGQSLSFQGTVIRRDDDETAISFVHPMDADVLKREVRMLQGMG